MRILLDECTPAIVKIRLTHRDIQTVQDMGWGGIKTGELLTKADKNLRYQQNLNQRGLAIFQLPTNQVPIVETLLPAIDAALDSTQIGDFVEIPFPSQS